MNRVTVPRWMPIVLAAAGLFNITWGAAVIAAPDWTFRVSGLATPERPLINADIWQGLGLMIGLFGVGYLIAAHDPVRHWAAVAVGFIGKVLGPLGFLGSALRGQMPWAAGVPIIFTDLIWWVPLGLVLVRAWRAYVDDEAEQPAEPAEAALARFRTQHGPTLAEMSRASPVLLIGLRHLG